LLHLEMIIQWFDEVCIAYFVQRVDVL
jgi:hypothetical protein